MSPMEPVASRASRVRRGGMGKGVGEAPKGAAGQSKAGPNASRTIGGRGERRAGRGGHAKRGGAAA
jgi:hypothetical protein